MRTVKKSRGSKYHEEAGSDEDFVPSDDSMPPPKRRSVTTRADVSSCRAAASSSARRARSTASVGLVSSIQSLASDDDDDDDDFVQSTDDESWHSENEMMAEEAAERKAAVERSRREAADAREEKAAAKRAAAEEKAAAKRAAAAAKRAAAEEKAAAKRAAEEEKAAAKLAAAEEKAEARRVAAEEKAEAKRAAKSAAASSPGKAPAAAAGRAAGKKRAAALPANTRPRVIDDDDSSGDETPTRKEQLLTCSICCDEFPAAEGAVCPDGHFTHRGCLDMQCKQSLERDPVAVTESEKSQRCYAICCADMSSGCRKAFSMRSLANGLSNEGFEALGVKNVELGVHLSLPDAVKEHLAAVAASGQAATKEQHEKCIRDAYRRPDGSFRTERGELVRQCGACSFGPIIAQVNCGDMRAHDGEVRGRYVQNNRCLHCGHLNQGHYESWPRWDGVHVLGAVPSLVHGEQSAAPEGAPRAAGLGRPFGVSGPGPAAGAPPFGAARAPVAAPAFASHRPADMDDQTRECLQRCLAMGFERDAALHALRRTAGNMGARISQASEMLLSM